MNPRDRLAPAPGLRLHAWDDSLGVAYSASSGSTHLLSAAACRLLAEAARTPAGVGIETVDAPPELVEGLLRAGLVRRLP